MIREPGPPAERAVDGRSPLHSKRLDRQTYQLTFSGKLRGSCARRLESRLEELALDGVERILLDLTACRSIDSLGVAALETSLDLGQLLFVVTTQQRLLEQASLRRPLKVFATVEAALEELATLRGKRSRRLTAIR